MHVELRRNNTIGDSRGILHFTRVVIGDKPIKREAARQMCSFLNDMRINFNAAVALYEYLGIVELTAQTISTTSIGTTLKNADDDEIRVALCRLCLKKVVDDGILPNGVIHFNPNEAKYFIQKHGFPFSAAIFRNCLIQLKALHEQSDGALLIDEKFESVFAKVQKEHRRKMTLEQLRKKLEVHEIQGDAAEEFVLTYEQTRITNERLHSRIKRISTVDVTAGYDIVSFEGDNSVGYDRFIEVKSFRGDPHFYWSRNEMEVATVQGVKYHIYLVDADRLDEPGYEPLVINNPSANILDGDAWLIQPESYLVIRV